MPVLSLRGLRFLSTRTRDRTRLAGLEGFCEGFTWKTRANSTVGALPFYPEWERGCGRAGFVLGRMFRATRAVSWGVIHTTYVNVSTGLRRLGPVDTRAEDLHRSINHTRSVSLL